MSYREDGNSPRYFDPDIGPRETLGLGAKQINHCSLGI